MPEITSNSQESVSFTKTIMVDGVPVMNLMANISTNDPENMNYSPSVTDYQKYYKNRDRIDIKKKEFEDLIAEKQNEMIENRGMFL